MRAFTLVLLVAASAFAAPSQNVQQGSISNFIAPLNLGPYSAAVATAFTLVDAADTPPYVLTLFQIILDLLSLKDNRAQAIGLFSAVATMGTLVSGYPGDSCAAAYAIDNYAAGGSAASYKDTMVKFIDYLVQVHKGPYSRHFAYGPSGNCVGGGFNNNMSGAWDRILDSCSPATIALVNEEYCTVKSLYNANSIRSNDVSNACTAAVALADDGCDHKPFYELFNALAYQGDVVKAADACKLAIMS